MRVTISRKFTIKSKSINAGAAAVDDCMTKANADSMYENDEATDKYTHVTVIAEGGNSGVAEEMNVYLVDQNYTYCTAENCSSSTELDPVETDLYDCTQQAKGCLYATYQEQHYSDGDDEHMLVYKLTAPYTVTMIPPTLDIGFGTQKAAGAYEVSNKCEFWIEEPIVTITLN